MKHSKLNWLLSVFAATALLCSMAVPALAADCASLDFDQAGSITVTLSADDETIPEDGVLTIYQVADLVLDDGNMAYVLTQDFADSALTLDEMTGEVALSFATYAEENSLSGVDAAIDENGTAVFQDLTLGVYLVVQTTQSTGYYSVDSFLVTVPMEEGDNWVYDVDASPKVELYSQPEEVEDTPTVDTPTTTDETLPQTGQMNWPIPVLALLGVVLIALGSRLARTGKGKRSYGA